MFMLAGAPAGTDKINPFTLRPIDHRLGGAQRQRPQLDHVEETGTLSILKRREIGILNLAETGARAVLNVDGGWYT